MRNKIFLFIALTLAASVAFSQNAGFKIGAAFSNINFEKTPEGDSDQEDYKITNIISPKLGFNFRIPIQDGMFAETGVYGVVKGFKEKYKRVDTAYVDFTPIIYMEIPACFGYKHDFDGMSVFGMTGPYLGVAFYTTHLYEGEDGQLTNDKLTIGNGDKYTDFIQRFDFGWNLEAGIQLSRFTLSAYYSYGILNVLAAPEVPFEDITNKGRNQTFGFNFGILFGQVDHGRGRGRGGRSWRR